MLLVAYIIIIFYAWLSVDNSCIRSVNMAESTTKELNAKKGIKEEDDKLLEPFNYIFQNQGKKIRPKLLYAFNFWLTIPEDKLETIVHVIESIHNASLIIDDIEDDSTLRRGLPAAHLMYSMKSSINSSTYAILTVLKMCAELGQGAISIITEQFLKLCRGQGLEIYWKDNYICPTEDEYCLAVKGKTGGLFVMGIQLTQLFSDKKYDFTNVVENIGLYFQINDDYINLTSKEYMKGKGMCEDLSEGKFGFPLIHAIKHNPEILQIVRTRPKDDETKQRCVQLIETCGSFEYTRMKMESLRSEIEQEIDKTDIKNPYMEPLLSEIFNSE